MLRAGLRRIAVIEAVDVRQQDDAARARRLRDARREPVVVAKADFLGRDAVIFVDDRHDAQGQEPVEGPRGVAVARSEGSRVGNGGGSKGGSGWATVNSKKKRRRRVTTYMKTK